MCHITSTDRSKTMCRWGFITIVLLLFIFFSSACASVNHLREAQAAFSQAAEADNKLRLNGIDVYGDGVTATQYNTQRSSGYSSVIQSIELLKKDEKQFDSLFEAGLWGHALTLKAMAQWRLGMYENAKKTANTAKSKTNLPQLHPRDRAIIEALPSLIKIDEAYDRINSPPVELKVWESGKATKRNTPTKDCIRIYPIPDECKETIKNYTKGTIHLLKTANSEIDNTITTVSETHPIRGYFYQSQLASYANLKDAYYLNGKTVWSTVDQDAFKKAKTVYCELDGYLTKKSVPEETQSQVLGFWGALLGFPDHDCSP